MIKLEHTDVYGFEAAIRGMRNPFNSWDKSDSITLLCDNADCHECKFDGMCQDIVAIIGENDLALMRKLARAGDDHGKFARFINVPVDITAPLYWWKEFDTYKVGTVLNSCSTMHKIHEKEFTLDDFSHEHLVGNFVFNCDEVGFHSDDRILVEPLSELKRTIQTLNYYRKAYLETKSKMYWWQLIQLLPSSYNQRRTVQINYQVLNRIYRARKNHKLDEWHEFCDWIEKLPYFKQIYLGGEND